MSPLRVAQAIEELGGAGVSSWNDLTDKPSTFPPSTHTHAIADTTGLETALLGKASAAHTHPLSDLTTSGATTGQVATFNGSAWVPQSPSSGVTSYNDLTNVPSTFPPSTHTHAAADITTGTLALARIPTGTTSTTVCIGNDSRLSDARTPTAHTHPLEDVTGLETALDGKQASGSYVTTSGGITAIAVVATMPGTPDPTTLYIVTT
jgi:hypothetical protein